MRASRKPHKVFKIEITEKVENLPVDSFLTLVDGITKSLVHISKKLSETGRFKLRVKSITFNSPGVIELVADDSIPEEIATAVFSSLIDGSRMIQDKRLLPSDFDEEAFTDFGKAMRTLHNGLSGADIKLSYSKKHVKARPRIVDAIKEIEDEEKREAFESYGSVEGNLEMIKAGHKITFRLYGPSLQRSVLCKIPHSMRDQALDCFEKRISVTGTKHYNKNGILVSVDVVDIYEFPAETDLPTLDDMQDIDLTGGEEVCNYIARLRNVG